MDGSVAILTNTTGRPVLSNVNGVVTTVGMSMAPALWLVDFSLIYTLNPSSAATPAYRTLITRAVSSAIYFERARPGALRRLPERVPQG
jgi:hypothetical protein